MKYILYLHKGFKSNDISFTFGMSKQEVHDLMGKEPEYIMNTLEYYDDFRVDYDTDDKVSAFEFFSWADVVLENDDFPDLKGINLFSISNSKLDRTIKKHDSSAEVDGVGIVSLKYGIGTYCENSDSEPSDTVIIFRKGYYDSLL
ncbi:MAG: hypothetical protein NC177_06080 [Ruminococcus flavefaciens]|nr:hypothetical protein [Ruminococcus flavefaciens]